MRRFNGHVAVVTSGSNGISAAVCERLAAEGASVASLDVEKPQEPIAGVMYELCDVTDAQEIERSVAKTTTELGPVAVLVNNAGINSYASVDSLTEVDWERFFALDLKAAWLCARAVLPAMRSRGSGAIVNVASIHAHMTQKGMFPYAAAKSGIIGLTRSMALEVSDAVRVNAVSPGYTRTRVVERWLAQRRRIRLLLRRN